MDRQTIAVYDAGAVAYREQRGTAAPDAAEALAASVPAGAVRADLGCGPGLYLPHLGAPVLALDAAFAMLAVAPPALKVQADLAALPLRRGCLAGVWASKCYQHVPHDELPAALADLHRAAAVGAPVSITVFSGEGTMVTDAEDSFPGRRFSLWSTEQLVDLAVGAGFEVLDAEPIAAHWPQVRIAARRARTLADHVGPGMRLLLCGLNPSLYSAERGVNYARPGNRFWPALLAAGLASVALDPAHALRHHGVGMTDLVKRATVAASELTTEEYATGVARVERLGAWLRPAAICMVGLAGWRAAVDRRATTGWQPAPLGGVPVYLMPSTSGLNASTQHAGFVGHLLAAARGPGGPVTGSGR